MRFWASFLFVLIMVALVLAGWGMYLAWTCPTKGFVSSTFSEFLLVFVLAAEGAFAWVHFSQTRAEDRVTILDLLYGEVDNRKMRRARRWIYSAPPEKLVQEYLFVGENIKDRNRVEDAIAVLDRMSYRLRALRIDDGDAYWLWGGATLQTACRLWPYVIEQRQKRSRDQQSHMGAYAGNLEILVNRWIPRYCEEYHVKSPPKGFATYEKLKHIFPD